MGRSTEAASAIVAIAQMIFSSITIYRTRGDQIEKYGYAAYGLTVYPYALMSLANLIKLAACGRHPFVYVLRTATLVEAERSGRVFEGAIGGLELDSGRLLKDDEREVDDLQHDDLMAVFSEPPTWLKFVSPFPWFRPLGDYRNYQWIASITGSLIFVIAIFSQPVFVFLISGFNHGQSTRIQRIWMLGWLIANEVSVAIGLIVFWNRFYLRFYWHLTFFSSLLKTLFNWRILVVVMLLLLVYAFAIGGFVTVGAMLRAENYQLCNAI